MGDANYNGVAAWLLDTFGDPIWRHDQCPWRRHNHPPTSLQEYWDESTDEFLRPDYPHSEPDCDPPEWCLPRYTFPRGPEARGPAQSSVEPTELNLVTIMEQVADPYWAHRGWVLHLIISWSETSTNRFTEGDQTTRKGDRASRYHQTRTTTQRNGAHPAISMSWDSKELAAEADLTAGPAIFTT